MSETDSNIPAGAFSPEDTKTRKTVRLHPAQGGAHLLKQEKIADPLGGRDTDTSNLEILDDTQTRRTVKIKPLAPPSANTVKIPLDAENTNTRKSVALHPQSAASGEDTRTRKTVVLHPTAAPAPAPAAAPAVEVSDETVAVVRTNAAPRPAVPIAPAPAKAPAPAPAPAVEVSDETVAVVKPRIAPRPAVPIAPAPAKAPAPAAVPAVEVSDETVSVAKPAPAAAAAAAQGAEESDDQTVKIKRPAGPPRIGPRPMGQQGAKAPALMRPAAPAAPAGTAPQAEGEESSDIKETVKLPQPKRPAGVPFGPRATPAKPAAPFKPATPPKPAAAAPAAAPEEIPEEKDGEEDDIALAPSEKKRAPESTDAPLRGAKAARDAALKKAQSNAASPLYLVLGLVTLLLMLGATVFSLAQYLDFEQKIQIYDHIPGLPRSK